MNTVTLSPTSSVGAKYWSELKDLSNSVKLELITLLSSSVASSVSEPSDEKGRTSRFAGTWKDDQNERLDAALARFHGDWGGDKDPVEIAKELRQGPDMVRDVETW